MELSRKETYRNQRVSIGVTLLSFVVMLLFFIFTNVVTANPVAATASPQFALNLESGNSDASLSTEEKQIASASQKGDQVSKIETTQAETPVEQGVSEIITKFRTSHFIDMPQNTTSEMHEPSGKEGMVNTGTDTKGTEGFNKISPLMGYDLSDRIILKAPEFENTTQEQGKVVVDIIVDKNGTVIEANPNGRGTTTSSSTLKREAAKMALATKFNTQQKFEEQKGTITINFSFH